MNYLNEQQQKELLPRFTGTKVHNARIEYSSWGEHGVSFDYYKREDDRMTFFDEIGKTFQGGTEFTTKKEALAFIKAVNKPTK